MADRLDQLHYTIVDVRAPGMTWFRMPLTIWSLFIVAVLLLLALPVLTSALAMLLLACSARTFLSRRGEASPCCGNTCSRSLAILRSMFWCLPAMGVGTRKFCRVHAQADFGYRAMVFSMIAIAFLSWVVWGRRHLSERHESRPGHGVRVGHSVHCGAIGH